jgi:hypothetical protein
MTTLFFHHPHKRLNTARCKEFQQLLFSAHMSIHTHRNESPRGAIWRLHNTVQLEVSRG